MEVALVGRRILHEEQTVVLAHLCLDAMVGAYPVECALYLAVGAWHSALAVGVVLSLNLDDVSFCVLCATGALHDVGVLQSNLLARCQTEELLGSVLHEVGPLDPKIL